MYAALASTTASETPRDALVYQVPIYLLPYGVSLQASAFRVRSPLLPLAAPARSALLEALRADGWNARNTTAQESFA